MGPLVVALLTIAALVACDSGDTATSPAPAGEPSAPGAEPDGGGSGEPEPAPAPEPSSESTADVLGPESGGEDGGPPEPEPELPCPDPSICDDGLACTLQTCTMPGESCTWELLAESCLIGTTCYGPGEGPDPCLVCAPELDPYGWTLQELAPCDDGDLCTTGDGCAEGTCVGGASLCDDDNPCTVDTCDGGSGACEHGATPEGDPCDDGDACTTGEVCKLGGCAGALSDCDDEEPCTEDACDPSTGCTHAPLEGPCEDGDPCTAGDHCEAGTCEVGSEAACEDANSCTLDACDPLAGCLHLPTESPCCIGLAAKCDDGDPCTDDLCDAQTAACANEPHQGPCDDADPCTLDDACTEEGECTGSLDPCDDDEPCTEDGCSPGSGCWNTAAPAGPCDDGLPCSIGDHCEAGVCVADTTDCVCEPDFGPAMILVAVALGEGGHPGEGLDLDGDPATCAPSADCSAGIDNSLGVLASFANEPLQESIDKGDLVLLVETLDLDGAAPALALYVGDPDPEGPACGQGAPCSYLVDGDFVDPESCDPTTTLAASVDGSSVTAGSPSAVFPLALSLAGITLDVPITGVQVELELDGAGGATGLLGGAVPKAALLTAVEALPEDAVPPPFTKDLVKSFIETLETDIDGDGDGTPEAVSIGLKLEAIVAILAGVQ